MKALRFGAATSALLLAGAPLTAQPMQGMDVPGMTMPGTKSPKKPKKAPPPQPARASAVHAAPAPASAAPAMPGMDHGAMDHADTAHGSAAAPAGTDLPADDAPAPAAPADFYADRAYPPAAMERARATMMREQGGRAFGQILFNLAEFQARGRGGGHRWDGEAWLGGDVDRLMLRTEGEGTARDGTESAEVQALYSRAVGPYFALRGGLRVDVRPAPARAYATIGIEGLAPYGLEVEAALFVSHNGDVLARAEAWYDQRITQRLILQPRAELNFAARDVPQNGYGAGLIDAELGLRLRYEIAREFAPYVGISWERAGGRTADFARAAGEGTGGGAHFVSGIRFWF